MEKVIIDYIREQILNNANELDLTPNSDLLGNGLVDSMGMMKLIGFIEIQFELAVPPEDMTIENFITVSAINQYLVKRKSNLG